jgi:hypothetical protein
MTSASRWFQYTDYIKALKKQNMHIDIEHSEHIQHFHKKIYIFNPLTPELNPSAQRCLTRIFTADFAS